MTFAAAQTRILSAKLRSRYVREREADGLVLHYLEGWHVMAEANRIFGFDGWDRETLSNNYAHNVMESSARKCELSPGGRS